MVQDFDLQATDCFEKGEIHMSALDYSISTPSGSGDEHTYTDVSSTAVRLMYSIPCGHT
jgi:hypothetical protein